MESVRHENLYPICKLFEMHITQNANKFDTKWAVPVKSETPTVLPSEIYCSTSIRTGSKHRVDTLNKTVITMWFTKQPTYFLGASVRTAMYQTVCCQRATTITTTTTLQEEKKKQIEFVANYGIICLKMANSLLPCFIWLFPNAIEWFSFYFCVCIFAFGCRLFLLYERWNAKTNSKCWNKEANDLLKIYIYKRTERHKNPISISARTSGAQEEKNYHKYITRCTHSCRATNRFYFDNLLFLHQRHCSLTKTP